MGCRPGPCCLIWNKVCHTADAVLLNTAAVASIPVGRDSKDSKDRQGTAMTVLMARTVPTAATRLGGHPRHHRSAKATLAAVAAYRGGLIKATRRTGPIGGISPPPAGV